MSNPSGEGPNCPGFQPSVWNRKKCKICGNPLGSHEKTPSQTDLSSSDLSTSSSHLRKDSSTSLSSLGDKSPREPVSPRKNSEGINKPASPRKDSGADKKDLLSNHRKEGTPKKEEQKKGRKSIPVVEDDTISITKKDNLSPKADDDQKDKSANDIAIKELLALTSEPLKFDLKQGVATTQESDKNLDGDKKDKRDKKLKKEKSEKKIKKSKDINKSSETPKEDKDNRKRGDSSASKNKPNAADDDRGRDRTESVAMDAKETVGPYILVDKIGKGAYGVVYKALNMFEGNTVAIKKLNLKNASKEVVESLQAEINLLKSLDHGNIVRYIDHYTKGKELSIVMEYIENGSLATMVKKYGRFPEPLCKTYVRKVVVGLDYLHDQGVIHRDIKPDNILITKNGDVKLADFGVSTKLSSLKNAGNEDETVPAGTPYYMAPEVIEFQGARPESDIWSLGCTIIELLRGEPPYFNCDPFSAMYKMVEDEHPPLPSGISQSLYHFLMECFKKNVNYRVGAKGLLKLVWLKMDTKEKDFKVNTPSRTEFNKMTEKISDFNKELSKAMNIDNQDTAEENEKATLVAKSQTLSSELRNLLKNKRNQNQQAKKAEPQAAPAPKKTEAPKSQQQKLVLKADDDEDWDADFADNLTGKFKGLQLPTKKTVTSPPKSASPTPSTPTPASDLKAQAQKLALELDTSESSKTETLGFSGALSGISLKLKDFSDVNLDDLDFGEADAEPVFATPAKPTVTSPKSVQVQLPKTPISPPKASPPKGGSGGTPRQSAKASIRARAAAKPGLNLNAWSEEREEEWDLGSNTNKNQLLAALEGKQSNLNKFQEEEEGFEDFEIGQGTLHLKLNKLSAPSQPQPPQSPQTESPRTRTNSLFARLEKKKAQEWDDWVDVDTELTLYDEADVQDEEALLKEKAKDALGQEIKSNLASLKPTAPEGDIKQACLKLMDIFDSSPDMKHFLITNHGLLPLITLLDTDNTNILNSVLRLITQIVEEKEILVNMCVMGIIPSIMVAGNESHSSLTRLYAAYFVQRVISTPATLQMFVACRGLPVLVNFLEPEYKPNRDIVHLSIDCISSIFKIQGQTATPKNEYCHLFVSAGLLERLSQTLINLLTDEEAPPPGADSIDDDELSYVQKISKIFKVFSMGDADVKLSICSKEVLPNIKAALKVMKPKSKECYLLLHTFRNISFDRAALNHLGIIIVPLLEVAMFFVKKGEFIPEIFNQITHALYQICRMNKARQEAAVKAGLIPFLLFVIQKNKPLKEFAVPLMCELAGSSQVTRSILLDNNGLNFYFDLLKDPKGTFLTDAMEAIAVCLENERERVEQVMLSSQNINLLKETFTHVQEQDLLKLLESMLKVLTCSVRINKEISQDTKDTSFISVLKSKLTHPLPLARVNLLRSLQLLCAKSADPAHFLKNNSLLKVVKYMASNDSSMLVKNMAVALLKEGGITTS